MTVYANFGHVEWQSLDLFSAVQNVAQLSIETSPLPTGLAYSRVLKFTGHADPGGVSQTIYRTAAINTGGFSNCLLNIYLRWSDLSPANEYRFLTITGNDTFGVGFLYFILEADGDIRVMDDDDATIATIIAPLTVDTWHRLEVYYFTSAGGG